MAWEDRTPAQKKLARIEAARAAAEDRADGNRTYIVTTAKGTRLTVQGITSARVVAGEDGTYKPK